MKKLLLFGAFMTFMVTTTQAQDFRFGAKAGVNFASVNGDDVEGISSRTSFHVGAVARIGISELFAIQPELVYSSQGYSSEEDSDVTVNLDYINLPIMADFTLAEGLSLQGGPQIGFNISSKIDFDGEKEDIEDIKTLDLGVGIGAQYVLPMNLFFQARYVIGFSDLADDVNAKNSVISLSVGYFFN